MSAGCIIEDQLEQLRLLSDADRGGHPTDRTLRSDRLVIAEKKSDWDAMLMEWIERKSTQQEGIKLCRYADQTKTVKDRVERMRQRDGWDGASGRRQSIMNE